MEDVLADASGFVVEFLLLSKQICSDVSDNNFYFLEWRVLVVVLCIGAEG